MLGDRCGILTMKKGNLDLIIEFRYKSSILNSDRWSRKVIWVPWCSTCVQVFLYICPNLQYFWTLFKQYLGTEIFWLSSVILRTLLITHQQTYYFRVMLCKYFLFKTIFKDVQLLPHSVLYNKSWMLLPNLYWISIVPILAWFF